MSETKKSFIHKSKKVLRRIYIGKSERIGARQVVRLLFLVGFTISLVTTPFQTQEIKDATVVAAPSNTPVPEADVTTEAEKAAAEKAAAEKAAAEKAAAEKAAAEKAAAEKAAAEKAASSKTDTSSEKLAGFDAAHIRSFKTMVSNIRAYVSAVNSGNTVRSSQVCDLLDENYNGSLRGVYTRSSNTQIQEILDFAKDSMYAGVVDCTRGFRKGRVDLIGDSVTAFIAASKYLDGLVMVSQVK
jgi:nucleoid-associated protein YgaU